MGRMSDYEFIIDNIRFSYSSTSTFDNCAYSFKLSYIDLMPRKNNFFAEYGTLVHECMEKFFRGELEMFELSDFYWNNFDNYVVTYPPPIPFGMRDKYKQQGKDFFDFFFFDKSLYEILVIEGKFKFQLDGINFVAKPDLVVRNKETNKNVLIDYKTSYPFKLDKKTGELKKDFDKINSYYKQMYTYTYSLRQEMGINIDKIALWFPRADKTVSIDWNKDEEDEAVKWIVNNVKKIRKEEVFPYNNKNEYFCKNLCSVRDFCEYW